ncbi:MAG TPA: type I-MYXAN CRISPR-associated protein Cas6/Cmx6 [Gammaproteobacteria bacterium]
MFWQEEENPEHFVVPDRIVDLAFAIDCKTLPVDHAQALSDAIMSVLPWFANEPEAGMHVIHVAESGNGWMRPDDVGDVLYLSRRTKMTLRLPKERVADAQHLSGHILMVAGSSIKVGEGKVRLLSNTSTLYARFVVSPEGESEEAFLTRVVQELREDGLNFKKVIAGKANMVCSHEGLLMTRSLMVGDLKPVDAIALQESGLGSHHKLGCGLFIPHKSV